MPPTAPDSSPFDSDERSEASRGTSWRSSVLSMIARMFESIARAATRIAERSRAAAGETAETRSAADVGDVVTDAEIESARGLFGLGSGPIDTDPSWPHGRPTP